MKIGWASRDFTPRRPAMIQGQMYVRIGRSAMDPLTVTALALDGGRLPAQRVILISCDLAMVSDALQAAVRKEVCKQIPGLPANAIIMNATHTHDSLVLDDGFYPHPGGDIMTAEEGTAWIAQHAAAAAVEAWKKRMPRVVGRAFGHAVVGHNRRAVYADGLARMYGKTNDPTFSHIEGYEDHSVDMLFTWDRSGRLAGVALDIPCPSQVDEHLEKFSADYWHEIRVELRRRLGQQLYVLPLCGAAGDQSPHFLLYKAQEEEMRKRRGVTERQEIAIRVADAVMRALKCTKPVAGKTPLVHACKRLRLSPRRISRSERDWAVTARKQALARGMKPDLWWPKRLDEVVHLFDRGKPMPRHEVECHVLRLGDAVLATNPFELYQDHGLQIKARSPAKQTFIVQLAGGTGLYLPTERAVQGGHYGAHPVVAPVGPEGGRELVEATLKMFGTLFK